MGINPENKYRFRADPGLSSEGSGALLSLLGWSEALPLRVRWTGDTRDVLFTWTIAQKGGPDLGSGSGIDRTLRGCLDRDGSGVGCLGIGLGTILQVLGLASGVEGGHTVGFLNICLPVFLDVYHMDMHMDMSVIGCP